MNVTSIYRTDATNVGDWYCAPSRYFADLRGPELDILQSDFATLEGAVILGGGGLIARTFAEPMTALAQRRPALKALIAWGVGESLIVDRSGGFVPPYDGELPDYLQPFDLVGVRDYGAGHRWTPCASCLLPQFDAVRKPSHDIVVYEHKRIPIPIDGFPRRTNGGDDIDEALAFLASGELVITNSYHGAYWATLLGRRVIAIPNMSKMYRFKHAPILCRPENWHRHIDVAVTYPEALTECRAANHAFHRDVQALLKS